MEGLKIQQTLAEWNERGMGYLSGHLDMEILAIEPDEVWGWHLAQSSGGRRRVHGDRAEVQLAWHRARRRCHLRGGPSTKAGTTQVWDAEVRSDKSGKAIAVFRCTQMILR